MSERPTSKIAIIGAGCVGATIAYACLIRGVGKQIALYDVNRAKVDAEVLDLNHGLQFVPMATIEGSDDVGDLRRRGRRRRHRRGEAEAGADAGWTWPAANAEICRKLLPELLQVAPDAVLPAGDQPGRRDHLRRR